MATVVPLRFRPTVVLCVGDEGREVGAHLGTLLAGLDAPRRAGVALLAVREERGQLAGGWFEPGAEAVTGYAPAGEVGPTIPVELLTVEALRGQGPERVVPGAARRSGVLEDAVLARITEEGAAVPRALAVVWVVAAADSPHIERVCAAVRAAVESERVACWVLLALTNVYPRDPERHREQAARCAAQPWQRLLVGGDGDGGDGAESAVEVSASRPLATFAYLFETHAEHDTFWERPGDVAFSTAEAIFVLTATGIPTTREFEETLRRSMPRMVHQPYERISSVGTSRLTFPRPQAEQYCASRLGAVLLREWRPPEDASVDTREEVAAAQAFVADMRRQYVDSDGMRRGGQPSPRLSAEGVAQARGLARPDPDGGLIFRHLGREHVERLITARRGLPEALRIRAARAEEGVAEWREAVRGRWEIYEREVERTLGREANELALQGAAGISRARAYVQEVDRLLAVERARAHRRQEQRENGYRAFLDELDDAAIGPWEDAGTGASVARDRRVDEGEPDGQDDGPRRAPQDALAARLAARYRWRKQHQPPAAALAGAALAMTAPAVFLGQALLPPAWLERPAALLVLTVALLALLGAVGWAYAYYHKRLVDEAAADLRALYRRRLVKRCEDYEYARRVALLTGLHNRVRQVLMRLIAWDSFMRDLARQMEREADRIEEELFDGATGRRDVLLANRQRLRRSGYNLRAFEEHVSAKRATTPKEGFEWHRTPGAILLRLRDALRGINVVDADLSDLTEPIRAFCLTVVRPYLEGDLVSIGAALNALPDDQSAGLFDTLVERSVILYRPFDTPRPAGVFIAARDEYRRAISRSSHVSDAVLLRIEDDEWLVTLRLLPGGAVPSFWRRLDEREIHNSVPLEPAWPERLDRERGAG